VKNVSEVVCTHHKCIVQIGRGGLQCSEVRRRIVGYEFNDVSEDSSAFSLHSTTLYMEARSYSKILVNCYQTTWRHVQKLSNLNSLCRENLKSHVVTCRLFCYSEMAVTE
jgi:hypothetical protein